MEIGGGDLNDIADVLLRHPHVWTLSDDIYEHIIYDGVEFVALAVVEPRLRDRILIANGVSKSYSMTRWRIGYGAGPEKLIQAIMVVQSQSTSCPCSISQAAAVEALTGPQEIVAEHRKLLQAQCDIVVGSLNKIAALDCSMPQGAFYVFASCAGLLGRRTSGGDPLESDIDFCRYLLDAVDVAVVPGACFGLAPFFRISYPISEGELMEACGRIERACRALV